MSDDSVHAALRSDAPLVVVEAPAGCGKTHQGAEYARALAGKREPGRPLILTHTHAARSVFATRANSSRVDVRTLDSVIVQIAGAYHSGLDLPPDPVAWVRTRPNGYGELAVKAARLLETYPMIAAALAQRHPVVICDEHQDTSGSQHAVVNALLRQGARVRIFGDPLQKIFREDESEDSFEPCDWEELRRTADKSDALDHAHRWENGCRDLGRWVLRAREQLKGDGGVIDLREGQHRPQSLRVLVVENIAEGHNQYRVTDDGRRAINDIVNGHRDLLILTRSNGLADALCSFFGRRIPLWEGHARTALGELVTAMTQAQGDPAALARAAASFMRDVGVGLTASAFGRVLEQEAAGGCKNKRRGKSELIQRLARCVLDEPTHRGVSALLELLAAFQRREQAFADIKIDRRNEFWEAVRLGQFETPDAGLGEITHRRTYAHPKPAPKAITNIHKAKGLECRNALILPCDRTTFPNTSLARRLLYVALSRASHSLTLVVSRKMPSPLFLLDEKQ